MELNLDRREIMIKIILFFMIGLILIIKGGSWFVGAASWIAETTGIPKFIVGATIVSLATTAPEQFVSIIAVLEGSNNLGIGNAIGSVSCNIGIAMAISIIARPPVIDKKDYRIKGFIMLFSAVLLWILTWDGILSSKEGIILFLLLLLFIYVNVKSIKDTKEKQKRKEKPSRKEILLYILHFIAGAAGIVIGAKLLVDNGTELARVLGVSEAVIGLTLIAIGTSLPEIVTTITSIVKKESGMSLGNIVGANIIDMTLILSVCSFLSSKGLIVAKSTTTVDFPVAIGLIAVAVIPTLIKGNFMKWQGFLLAGIYSVYMVSLIA